MTRALLGLGLLVGLTAAQAQMPPGDMSGKVLSAGTSPMAGVRFFYARTTPYPTDEDPNPKKTRMFWVEVQSYRPFTPPIEIQVALVVDEPPATQEEQDINPMDVCLVDYGRVLSAGRDSDGLEQFVRDSRDRPTFMQLHGDRNHTDCEQPYRPAPVCRDDQGKTACCCGGTRTRIEYAPGKFTTGWNCNPCPLRAEAAPLTTAVFGVVRGQAAQEAVGMLQQLEVRRPFKKYMAATMFALESQAQEWNGTERNPIVQATGGVVSAATGPGLSTENMANLGGISNGVTRDILPGPGVLVEPSPEWCATRDWGHTWRHAMYFFTGDVTFRGKPICENFNILIDKGRCEHAGQIQASWNPCSGEPFHINRVSGNHGRVPCINGLQCTNGLSLTNWTATCPYRTYDMQYAKAPCASFYSLFSNAIRFGTHHILDCPTCFWGHNCLDDEVLAYKKIRDYTVYDPIYGPPAQNQCSNPAGHYFLSNADLDFPCSCRKLCP